VNLMFWDSVLIHANWVVPTDEDDDCHECLPWYFDHNVRQHERLPRIGLSGTFSHFVQGTLCDEVRHDLLRELTENGKEHEDGEHLILKTLLTEWRLEEDETDEHRLCIVSEERQPG